VEFKIFVYILLTTQIIRIIQNGISLYRNQKVIDENKRILEIYDYLEEVIQQYDKELQ
jgi:hypothetical protein